MAIITGKVQDFDESNKKNITEGNPFAKQLENGDWVDLTGKPLICINVCNKYLQEKIKTKKDKNES